MKGPLCALALSLLLTACANQQFILNHNAGLSDGGTTQSFWFWGFLQEETVDAAQTCKGVNRIARIELSTSLSQMLLSVVTLGIYSPRTVTIRCLY